MQFPEPEIVEGSERRIVALARDYDMETRNLIPQLFKAFCVLPESGKMEKVHAPSMMRALCIQSVPQI